MSDPRTNRVRNAEETILDLHAENERLRAENERLQAAVKPLVDEILTRSPYRRTELYRLAIQIRHLLP